MKYVVVTGARGGMGKETVKKLSDAGYFVIACDLNTGEATSNVLPVHVDVTDDGDISRLERIVREKCDCLYGIINLAALFAMDSIVEGDEDKLRRIFEVNFWGTYKINKALLPLMTKDSRIIIMSSELADYSVHPFDGYYALPKQLLDCYADVLRRETSFLGIKVIKIRAGSFKTGLTAGARSEFDALRSETRYYNDVLEAFAPLVYGELGKGKDPRIIADLLLAVLNAKRPRLLYRIASSKKLALLGALPEKWQDKIYLSVVRAFSKR